MTMLTNCNGNGGFGFFVVVSAESRSGALTSSVLGIDIGAGERYFGDNGAQARDKERLLAIRVPNPARRPFSGRRRARPTCVAPWLGAAVSNSAAIMNTSGGSGRSP